MTVAAPAPARAAASTVAAVGEEIDLARARGTLQQIPVPPCPEALVRLRAALAAPEPDLGEVARIAAGDVAMAATLLRNANGPLYAGGRPAQTVGQAMNRLGLLATGQLMTGFLTRHAIRADGRHLARFWERAGMRADAMAHIAAQLPGMQADVAHTFGLFCHVGMPVLLQGVRGYAGTLAEAQARIDRSFVATENANHRTDHAVVGALVARVWKLAPAAMAAIRLHHDPAAIGDAGVDADVRTLLAAGLAAEQLVRRHEGLEPEAEWQAQGAAAIAWLGVGDDEMDHWAEDLQPRFALG